MHESMHEKLYLNKALEKVIPLQKVHSKILKVMVPNPGIKHRKHFLQLFPPVAELFKMQMPMLNACATESESQRLGI